MHVLALCEAPLKKNPKVKKSFGVMIQRSFPCDKLGYFWRLAFCLTEVLVSVATIAILR